MDFKNLLLKAQDRDKEAMTELIMMYMPMLVSEAILPGKGFDDDLFQELREATIHSVYKFKI